MQSSQVLCRISKKLPFARSFPGVRDVRCKGITNPPLYWISEGETSEPKRAQRALVSVKQVRKRLRLRRHADEPRSAWHFFCLWRRPVIPGSGILPRRSEKWEPSGEGCDPEQARKMLPDPKTAARKPSHPRCRRAALMPETPFGSGESWGKSIFTNLVMLLARHLVPFRIKSLSRTTAAVYGGQVPVLLLWETKRKPNLLFLYSGM